ncbi:unnamed protein product, partial [Amoebophrya sp. A120]|eukprot:GSA120T00024159001.1
MAKNLRALVPIFLLACAGALRSVAADPKMEEVQLEDAAKEPKYNKVEEVQLEDDGKPQSMLSEGLLDKNNIKPAENADTVASMVDASDVEHLQNTEPVGSSTPVVSFHQTGTSKLGLKKGTSFLEQEDEKGEDTTSRQQVSSFEQGGVRYVTSTRGGETVSIVVKGVVSTSSTPGQQGLQLTKSVSSSGFSNRNLDELEGAAQDPPEDDCKKYDCNADYQFVVTKDDCAAKYDHDLKNCSSRGFWPIITYNKGDYVWYITRGGMDFDTIDWKEATQCCGPSFTGMRTGSADAQPCRCNSRSKKPDELHCSAFDPGYSAAATEDLEPEFNAARQRFYGDYHPDGKWISKQ